MKHLFISAFFLLTIMMISMDATSDENTEPIKNPTFTDLQGKWDGTLSRPFRGLVWSAISKRYGKSVVMTFDGTKATYASADANLNMDVKIDGEDITLTGGKRTDTCKLSKSSDTKSLDCNFEVGTTEAHGSYSGKMHLEKKI